MAPHQACREGGKLLIESAEEIGRLRGFIDKTMPAPFKEPFPTELGTGEGL
jgi:hypothetical protein